MFIIEGRPRRTYTNIIDEVLQKGQMFSTRYWHDCMTRCMTINEMKRVCKSRSRRHSLVSAYFLEKKPFSKKFSFQNFFFENGSVPRNCSENSEEVVDS